MPFNCKLLILIADEFTVILVTYNYDDEDNATLREMETGSIHELTSICMSVNENDARAIKMETCREDKNG